MTDAQEVLEVLFKVQSEYMQWEPDDPQVDRNMGGAFIAFTLPRCSLGKYCNNNIYYNFQLKTIY